MYSIILLTGVVQMEFLQLKYFSHAAKTENFSHTAQHFMVPTSGVSASIKKLENEIGVKLFDRASNKIKLNEYGRILLKAVDGAEELFAKAKTDILDLSRTPFGEIKLLVLANRQKVTKAISEFRTKYPAVAFNIKHQGVVDNSSLKEYDVIITDQKFSADNFQQTLWFREQLYLATHIDNALSKKNSVSSDEIMYEKFICMPKGSSLRNCAEVYFEQNNINPEIIIECDDPQYIRNYVKMGLGVTLFPYVSWNDHLDKEVALLKIEGGLCRDSYIYTKNSGSNFVQLFSQILKSQK